MLRIPKTIILYKISLLFIPEIDIVDLEEYMFLFKNAHLNFPAYIVSRAPLHDKIFYFDFPSTAVHRNVTLSPLISHHKILM